MWHLSRSGNGLRGSETRSLRAWISCAGRHLYRCLVTLALLGFSQLLLPRNGLRQALPTQYGQSTTTDSGR